MPVMSGLEVVQNLTRLHCPSSSSSPLSTSTPFEAFEAGAIDYLLKPVSETRLRRPIERAKALMGSRGEIAAHADKWHQPSRSPGPPEQKIVGRNGEDYLYSGSDEVLAFQAERELVWIVTAKQRLLSTQPLRAIEERMSDPRSRECTAMPS